MPQFLSKEGKFFMKGGKGLQYIPPSLPSQGDLIKLNLDGNGNKEYRVLSLNGNVVKLLSMDDISTSQAYSATGNTGIFTNGTTGSLYSGSDLDTYLNAIWYNTLTDTAKTAIVPESRTQYMYRLYYDPDISNTYQFQENWDDSNYRSTGLVDNVVIGDRNVFVLDLKDIFDYFNKACITSSELMELWTNQTGAVDKLWWLSSAMWDPTDYAWCISGTYGSMYGESIESKWISIRSAFNIDLTKIPFTNVK